jgi:hypothetical protein
MPSLQPQIEAVTPYGVSSAMLKKHKMLPHPRMERSTDVYPTPPASKPRVLSVDTGTPSSHGSQGSSPRALKHASRRIMLPDPPPTPPTHSRQSSNGQVVIDNPTNREEAAKASSLPTTPTNQQSPPTPDVTPPRGTAQSGVPRPSITQYSSSRNDSFKTAKESFSSEDEDDLSTVRPLLPSARPSQVEVPQVAVKPYRLREVGLGLGLESENESTPSPKAAKRGGRVFEPKSVDDFVTFDGEWGSTSEMSEVEREWDHNLMRNVTVRRRRAPDSYLYNGSPSDVVLDDSPITTPAATKHLRRLPVVENLNTYSPESEHRDRTRTRGTREWPLVMNTDSPSTPDIRRFSVMSARSATTSTVVGVMVVDALPERRKTLRHTKKQLGLREFSSDQSTQSSATDSNFSWQAPHRLVHKSSGIFSRKHLSLESSNTTSTSSSAKSRKEIWNNGSIPVVVVPERRSSMKSARTPSLRSTSSRRTKRSMSLSSAPLSQSARANEPGYFDIPKRNHRRVSESAASPADNSQRTIDFPPSIPTRRSSLSAPTSRNTSRAGSLTAESLKAHNLIQVQAERPQPTRTQVTVESEKDFAYLTPRIAGDHRGSVDHNGDPFFGNRLSAQVTPFSQKSYETAFTAAELAQATSMALYPHTNDSILLVEQQSQPQRISPKDANGVIEPPKMAVNGINTEGPYTPPQPQVQDAGEVGSPLRNPREAPQPPAIKFIPPTPAALTPAQEEDRQLGHDIRPSTADNKPSRGMSLIRRALTNRRHSISAVTRPFSRRRDNSIDDSTQTPKSVAKPASNEFPTVSDQPADGSKLHPFWRPARFWDDLEGDDYGDLEDQNPYPYPRIDNRPARTPLKRTLSDSLKRTFAILPLRDDPPFPTSYPPRRQPIRRPPSSGSLRVAKARPSIRRAVSDGRSYYTTERRVIIHGKGNGKGIVKDNDFAHLWSGVRGLGRRMSERRRERRSEKLRRSISAPRECVDGVARVVGRDGWVKRQR